MPVTIFHVRNLELRTPEKIKHNEPIIKALVKNDGSWFISAYFSRRRQWETEVESNEVESGMPKDEVVSV